MTDTIADYGARIAERRALVRGFAEQVAQALTQLADSAAVDSGWDITPDTEDRNSAEIHSATGLTLHFRSPLYDETIQPNERLTVSAALGDLYRFAPSHNALEIGVGVNRGAAAVARDVARRLLPRLREVVEAAKVKKAEHKAKAQAARAAFDSLQFATTDEGLPDGCLALHQFYVSDSDGLSLEFSDDLHNLIGYTPGSTISLRGKVEGYDDPATADLTLLNLPLPLARQVCALVCGTAAAQRRAMVAAQPGED